ADGAALPARVSLIQLTATDHVAVVTIRRLCADTATLNVVLIQLARLYDAGGAMGAGGDAAGDAEGETLQYVDVAQWRHELLEGASGESGRAVWRAAHIEAGEACGGGGNVAGGARTPAGPGPAPPPTHPPKHPQKSSPRLTACRCLCQCCC